ncbi:hypothetical protein Glove_67g101 [Diversispora epigaea]|uniref:Uncharacterized protein n=1 Tax=Diversispora epigaea TaxID=1348612 RepID=A0A397JAE7_9GLOM|nr:hypothetical protein Glove_67g101 [Diversispora epigaea]
MESFTQGDDYDDPERLIKIFDDNFNKLRISFDCRDGFDANELLWKMVTNISIKIRMDCYDPQTKYFERAKEERLFPEQVIVIINNNFNELKIFLFDCGEAFDAKKLLTQLSLKTMKLEWDI